MLPSWTVAQMRYLPGQLARMMSITHLVSTTDVVGVTKGLAEQDSYKLTYTTNLHN